MSTIVDCPACMNGDHDNHVGPWNVRPGLLGGSVCCCQGDCDERSKAAFEAMFGQWGLAIKEAKGD